MGLAAAYAQDRKQFGQSISGFGLIQKKFAQMAALFFAAESMIYRTGHLIDGAFQEFGGTVDGNRKAAEEYAIECSACKVFATEAEALIVDEALQVYGGYGFTEEFPIARHYRDARVSRIYEGTNEINRLFIGERLRRRITDGRINGTGCGDSFISELAEKAIGIESTDQVSTGALSDLLTLSYAEQSARLRSASVGGVAIELYDLFLPWANARAAEAYQTLTGNSISLPACRKVDIASPAEVVYRKKGPAL
jgi:hypothetical protein